MSMIVLFRAYSSNLTNPNIKVINLSSQEDKKENLSKKYIEETFGSKISDKLFYISDKIKSIFRIS